MDVSKVEFLLSVYSMSLLTLGLVLEDIFLDNRIGSLLGFLDLGGADVTLNDILIFTEKIARCFLVAVSVN